MRSICQFDRFVVDRSVAAAGSIDGAGAPAQHSSAMRAQDPRIYRPASPTSPPERALFPTRRELRFARCCYDHLAGILGVAITEAAQRLGLAFSQGGEFEVTDRGKKFLTQVGIDVESLMALRRPLLRSCVDWTERRPHIAGSLGSALLRTYKEKRWLLPVEGSRKLAVTPQGKAIFVSLFDLDEDLFSAAESRWHA